MSLSPMSSVPPHANSDINPLIILLIMSMFSFAGSWQGLIITDKSKTNWEFNVVGEGGSSSSSSNFYRAKTCSDTITLKKKTNQNDLFSVNCPPRLQRSTANLETLYTCMKLKKSTTFCLVCFTIILTISAVSSCVSFQTFTHITLTAFKTCTLILAWIGATGIRHSGAT